MGRRMAYRMMLYGQTTDLRYGHRKSANSCFIHIWGCRRCPYSKISLARAIARTIGCIVSSINILRTPTFQIYSITSYCRYYYSTKIAPAPPLRLYCQCSSAKVVKVFVTAKFSSIKNQNTPSPESILNTRKIVSGLFGRHADFTQGSLDECYVVHNSKAVVVKSEAFEAPDKESIKQIINDVIEKLRT